MIFYESYQIPWKWSNCAAGNCYASNVPTAFPDLVKLLLGSPVSSNKFKSKKIFKQNLMQIIRFFESYQIVHQQIVMQAVILLRSQICSSCYWALFPCKALKLKGHKNTKSKDANTNTELYIPRHSQIWSSCYWALPSHCKV